MLHMLRRGMTREAGGALERMKPSMRAEAWDVRSEEEGEGWQGRWRRRKEATPMNLVPDASVTLALLQPADNHD